MARTIAIVGLVAVAILIGGVFWLTSGSSQEEQFAQCRAGQIAGGSAAIGGPFRLSLEDPHFGPVGLRTLHDKAMATSSPGAMMLGQRAHILHPTARAAPLWSTISVEADSAALADGLSTALCLASRDQIEEIISKTHTRATDRKSVG